MLKQKYRLRAHIAIFLLLVLLAGNGHVLAADDAQLISVSITNGTPMLPRTMFTETWTMTNTGTTTWSGGYTGYVMNIVGEDSLGAVPLIAKTYASPALSAPLVIGTLIAPGATAKFTMTFIAPEPPGPVADSFQLKNASGVFFGPTNTIQIMVIQSGSTNQYDRSRAVSYANNYSGYVNSDGCFWTNGSYYGIFTPLSPAPASGLGDDCAHFVSCCIGSEPHRRGGGLIIPQPRAAHLWRTRRSASGQHDFDRPGLCQGSFFVEGHVAGRSGGLELVG